MTSFAKSFTFALGDEVEILGQEGLTARIQAVLFGFDGVQYRIAYWRDCIRRVEWVFPREIKRLHKASPLGV